MGQPVSRQNNIPPFKKQIVLSVFTIALAIGACARRSRIPEEDRFVVDFAAFLS